MSTITSSIVMNVENDHSNKTRRKEWGGERIYKSPDDIEDDD